MMNKLALTTTVLLFAAVFAGTSAEGYESFEYVRVYNVELKDAEQIRMFQQSEVPVDVLNDIDPNGGSLQVAVAPKDRINFEKALEQIGASFKCIIQNLREILEERLQALPGHTTPTAPAMEWTKYHSLKDIYDFIDYLAARYPWIVRNYTIGYSSEGRPIKAMKISCKPGNKVIFMESNIHALEWISSAASTCFINNLLTSKDKEVNRLLCAYDWVLIPVVNPDGFEYTKVAGQQLWRKNRNDTTFSNSSGICYGVDLNRNFGDGHFKEAGYNIDVPCDHWYGGIEADSQSEVKSVQKFFNSFRKKSVCMYLAWHNFGNWMLIPYGHTNIELPPNYKAMMEVAGAFADSAFVRYGTTFKYGPSGVINYPVSGSGKDWAYNKKKVCFAATLELRPYSDSPYMFFLPAAQIQAVCDEVTDGFVGMMKKAEAIQICKKCQNC